MVFKKSLSNKVGTRSFKVAGLSCLICYRDLFAASIPEKYFARFIFLKGQIPLWNPYLLCGYPIIADIIYSSFYPISLFCYLLSFKASVNYYVIIHFFLGAVFMYYLLKKIDLCRLSCLTGAVVFSFGGCIGSTTGVQFVQVTIFSFSIFWPGFFYLRRRG